MKSKILTALIALIPFTSSFALIDEDGEVVDQFFVSMGTTGYILCKAVDTAIEEGFKYVKILKAEYSLGNQSGSFSCLPEYGEEGELLEVEDEIVKMSLSLSNEKPQDSDFMFVSDYQEILSEFRNELDRRMDEDEDFNFGEF